MSPLRSKSNTVAMPMVVANTNNVVRSAIHLWSSSSTRGTSIIRAAPTSGAKTARLGHERLRMSSICVQSVVEGEHEYPGGEHRTAEQQRAVLLDSAALPLANALTR